MIHRMPGRLRVAAFLLCGFSLRAAAQPTALAGDDLQRAFAASFALVPEVAKFIAVPACRQHGQQAAEVARARDKGMTQAAALELLAPPASTSRQPGDKRIDAAVTHANTAIAAYVFGPSRPSPELAIAIVNGACLLGARTTIGQIGV
ncbi:hypothetical protein [Variovorax rhizosphaerae]|uniref:Uncharacterized protein n=1 Tax=Variovorax rhizosphaerae TaxID=1836200 RepID=A0ABU8WYD1_9BURK